MIGGASAPLICPFFSAASHFTVASIRPSKSNNRNPASVSTFHWTESTPRQLLRRCLHRVLTYVFDQLALWNRTSAFPKQTVADTPQAGKCNISVRGPSPSTTWVSCTVICTTKRPVRYFCNKINHLQSLFCPWLYGWRSSWASVTCNSFSTFLWQESRLSFDSIWARFNSLSCCQAVAIIYLQIINICIGCEEAMPSATRLILR